MNRWIGRYRDQEGRPAATRKLIATVLDRARSNQQAHGGQSWRSPEERELGWPATRIAVAPDPGERCVRHRPSHRDTDVQCRKTSVDDSSVREQEETVDVWPEGLACEGELLEP